MGKMSVSEVGQLRRIAATFLLGTVGDASEILGTVFYAGAWAMREWRFLRRNHSTMFIRKFGCKECGEDYFFYNSTSALPHDYCSKMCDTRALERSVVA